MSHEPNNIDQLLRERLEGFEMAPPADVWTNTSAVLNASRRKRRMFMWLFLSIGAVVLLLGGLWYFNGTPAENRLAKEALTSTDSDTKALKQVQSNSEQAGQNRRETAEIGNESSDQSTAEPSRQGVVNPKAHSNSVDRNQSLATNKKGKSHSKVEPNHYQVAGNGPSRYGVTPPPSSVTPISNGGDHSDTRVPMANALVNENLAPMVIGSLPIMDVSSFPIGDYSLATSSFSKVAIEPSSFWKRFSVEGSIGFSSYRITASDPIDSTVLPFANATSRRHSFDARLGVNYHFKKGFSLQTGLECSAAKENYRFISEETTTMTYNDTISSYFDTTLNQTVYVIGPVSFDTTIMVETATQNYYKLLTLPFQFAWKMDLNPRSELEFALGGAVSIYGKNDGYTIQNASNTTIPSSEAYRTTGILSLGGSVKYIHRFGVHHSVYVEPWARIGITNMSTSMLPYDTRRNQYGIRVGYRFYF